MKAGSKRNVQKQQTNEQDDGRSKRKVQKRQTNEQDGGRSKQKVQKKQTNEHDEEQANDVEKKTRAKRMNSDQQELYLKLCVEHFEAINDTTTIRGMPSSLSVTERQERESLAWQNIAEDMNRRSGVGVLF